MIKHSFEGLRNGLYLLMGKVARSYRKGAHYDGSGHLNFWFLPSNIDTWKVHSSQFSHMKESG